MKFTTTKKIDFIFSLAIFITIFARPSLPFHVDEGDELVEERGDRAARLCESTRSLIDMYTKQFIKRNILPHKIMQQNLNSNICYFFYFSECFHGCEVRRLNLREHQYSV